MLKSGQIRAARAFLGWSARELAERANVHITTVQRMERRGGPIRANTESLRRIEQILTAAGIEFQIMDGCIGVSFRSPTHEEADDTKTIT